MDDEDDGLTDRLVTDDLLDVLLLKACMSNINRYTASSLDAQAAVDWGHFPRYTKVMNSTIRTGFDAERKLTLDQEDSRGVILDATPAERLAMVWPITKSCWAFTPKARGNAQRKFQRHVVRVRRGGG